MPLLTDVEVVLSHVDKQRSECKESVASSWISTVMLNMINDFEEHGVFPHMIRR